MAVTLAQSKLNVQDALQLGVIDEFQKSSYLMQNMIFDNVVSPTGGGGGYVYAYTRVKTQGSAGFRAINSEYTASEVEKERITTELKILGGTFEIDRVIADTGGIINEVQFQLMQKIKATTALFHDGAINGDTAVNPLSFEGLDKSLVGSSTEFSPSVAVDLSTSTAIDNSYKIFLDLIDEWMMSLDGRPTALLGNTKLIAKIRACARRTATYSMTLNEFGQQVEAYNGIPLVDLGTKPGSNAPIIATNASGETSLYAVRLGVDGFHALARSGNELIRTWLPDFTTAGAVKKGEVELMTAVALKATKAAGVFRKIKVQ